MNYAQAVQACIDGKKMTREIWEKENAYIVHLEGLSCFLRVKRLPTQDVGPWLAAIDDSVSEDWKVYEAIVEKKEEVVEAAGELTEAV